MARKEFAHHEAVSAVVPGEGGYSAAVAVKALDGMGAPRFHKILDGQKFKTMLWRLACFRACDLLDFLVR